MTSKDVSGPLGGVCGALFYNLSFFTISPFLAHCSFAPFVSM